MIYEIPYTLKSILEKNNNLNYERMEIDDLGGKTEIIFLRDANDKSIVYLHITNTENSDVQISYKFKDNFPIQIIDPLYITGDNENE